jgi:hypothetical protein
MEEPGEADPEWAFPDVLVAGDLYMILHASSERLLVTIWGSGSVPTRVPRAGLAEWFRARDAQTDDGIRTRAIATLNGGGTAEALLVHTFQRGERARSYETVDRWTFRAGRAVAWSSRPVDPYQYADAWGLFRPADVNTVSDRGAQWQVAPFSSPYGWPRVTGPDRSDMHSDGDLGSVEDGQ